MHVNPNMLSIKVVDSPDEAPNYNRDHGDIRTADVKQAIVVKRGMRSGKPTVDLLVENEDGMHVAMLTGEILLQLAGVITAAMADSQ